MLQKDRKNQLVLGEDEEENCVVTKNRTHCHCGRKYEVYRRIENKHNLINVCTNPECYSFINVEKLITWIPVSQESPIPEITASNI